MGGGAEGLPALPSRVPSAPRGSPDPQLQLGLSAPHLKEKDVFFPHTRDGA